MKKLVVTSLLIWGFTYRLLIPGYPIAKSYLEFSPPFATHEVCEKAKSQITFIHPPQPAPRANVYYQLLQDCHIERSR